MDTEPCHRSKHSSVTTNGAYGSHTLESFPGAGQWKLAKLRTLWDCRILAARCIIWRDMETNVLYGDKGGELVFEYRIVKSNTHAGLEEQINKAAAEGWEPIMVYAWNTGWVTAAHAVLLRRPAPGAV